MIPLVSGPSHSFAGSVESQIIPEKELAFLEQLEVLLCLLHSETGIDRITTNQLWSFDPVGHCQLHEREEVVETLAPLGRTFLDWYTGSWRRIPLVWLLAGKDVIA